MNEITLITKAAELRIADDWLATHNGRLVLDTETTGLDVFAADFEIGVVALGHSSGAVLAFPGRDRDLVRAVLQRAFATARSIWAHNAIYDSWALRATSELKLSSLKCSLVAARVAYPDRFPPPKGRKGPEHGFSLKDLRPTTQHAQDALKTSFSSGYPAEARRSDWLPRAVRLLPWDTDELLAYVAEDVVAGARLVDDIAADRNARPFINDEIATDQLWRWTGFDGIHVDLERLQQLADKAAPTLAEAEKHFGFKPWTGNKARQEYLRKLGVQLPTTDGGALKLGKKERPAAEVPEEAQAEWDMFCASIEAHSDQTQVAQFLASGGLLRGQISVNAAITGRSTSRNPNLQNMSPAIRETVIARPGCVLVGADLSHVEPSILAALSGDPLLIEHCARGRDVYIEVAAVVWGPEAFAVDAAGAPTPDAAKLRKRAKVVFLALSYGMGDTSFASMLGATTDEAKLIRQKVLGVYTGLARFSKELQQRARNGDRLTTLDGRNLPLLSDAPYRAVNYSIQASAATLFKKMTRDVAAQLPFGARCLIPVHDELVVECLAADAETVADIIRSAMHVEIAGTPVWGDPEIIGTRWRKS